MILLVIISVFGILFNLLKDCVIHNQKYFGTKRDIFKDNPMRQEQERKKLLQGLKGDMNNKLERKRIGKPSENYLVAFIVEKIERM